MTTVKYKELFQALEEVSNDLALEWRVCDDPEQANHIYFVGELVDRIHKKLAEVLSKSEKVN